ncbi:MAG: adenylosuccinate lyase [Cyclobacteriaceae bacterium]|nr:adenylosuccinate lyase [Cyclobacteriaceae bacterium]MCB0498528.1 adenylosuccinate lyase [Cyclobacteriaceae bacterium]MCB9236905.1 adenylosuccinate lyase [Flammeovirgaceae bacterium]MCO5271492.1 adenylosuccinate lyase [Cyclobacteriaceae bacterium]MCW5901388.1 adenylosuccinate lyase [Cyclobacteriaceae bacterium]
MSIQPLKAISPIDGRYAGTTAPLNQYFSEQALMKYRVLVEIEYFIALCEGGLPELAAFPSSKIGALRSLYINFSDENALEIKRTEKTTNHDVKAVEYFVKQEFDKLGLGEYKEFIHFGLTSQDVNNTATPLLLKEFLTKEFLPKLNGTVKLLEGQSIAWREVPMLARTHGQPASPTRLGKEMEVFVARLRNQLVQLSRVPYSAKFGGATGNFNAHHVAYPDIDWIDFGNRFVSGYLGLERSHPTTQIEHYDNMAALFDNLKRINTILIDYCRDVWQYISMNYFKQKINEGEVGSSAMPHKVNPIDFENAEGNLGLANALFEHLAAKLPISRLQRDLTDSTVLRNIGVPLAHSYLSLHSLERGINKLELNKAAIDHDLDENWAVVAEAIQTILRKEGYPNPYEALKGLTRKNSKVTRDTIHAFVEALEVKEEVKKRLKGITPFNYTGL